MTTILCVVFHSCSTGVGLYTICHQSVAGYMEAY